MIKDSKMPMIKFEGLTKSILVYLLYLLDFVWFIARVTKITSFIIFIFLLWSDCQSSEWMLLLKTHHTDKRNRQENVNERIFSLRKTSLPPFYDCYSGESVVHCWGYFSIQSYQIEEVFRKIIILTDVLIRRWNCKEIITFSLQTHFLINSTLAI